MIVLTFSCRNAHKVFRENPDNFYKTIDKCSLSCYTVWVQYERIDSMYNEKRKAITAKYVKTHLDDIKIRVPKGEREKLKAISAEMGMSMNQMFLTAVREYIARNYKSEKQKSNR